MSRNSGTTHRVSVVTPDRLSTLVLIGAALALLLMATSASAEEGKKRPRLMLLPIVVHSSEDPAYLREGLFDMLAARFDRIGALELIRGSDKTPGTSEYEEAVAIARKAGADYVLYGSFTRFGKGASLDVECSPTQAKSGQKPLREIFVHSGSIGEIIPDLDELAGKVSRFAQGEIIVSGAPNPTGMGLSPAQVQRLLNRVLALEEAVEVLEGGREGQTAARESDDN